MVQSIVILPCVGVMGILRAQISRRQSHRALHNAFGKIGKRWTSKFPNMFTSIFNVPSQSTARRFTKSNQLRVNSTGWNAITCWQVLITFSWNTQNFYDVPGIRRLSTDTNLSIESIVKLCFATPFSYIVFEEIRLFPRYTFPCKFRLHQPYSLMRISCSVQYVSDLQERPIRVDKRVLKIISHNDCSSGFTFCR